MTVPGQLVQLEGVEKVICRTPYFKSAGRTRVELKITEFASGSVSNSSIVFNGPLTIGNEDPNLLVEYERFATHVNLIFRWLPSLFTETGVNSTVSLVSIRMITYDAGSLDWKNALYVANNLSNFVGQANITLVFGNVSWQLAPEFVSRSFSAFRIDVSDPISVNGLPGLYVFKTGSLLNFFYYKIFKIIIMIVF